MKFCFYGSGIYDALLGNPPGGAELQVALIAKALSDKEHQVTIIDNKGNGTTLTVGTITVLFTGKSKLKGLRLIIEKIPNSFRYLMQTRADFYYIRGFSYLYLIAAYIAWRVNAQLILGLAHDSDVFNFRKRVIYLFKIRTSFFNWLRNDMPSLFVAPILLRMADVRLAQHQSQQKTLNSIHLKAVIFPNIFFPMKQIHNPVNSDFFIYVGSLNERKGLTELLIMINNCPRIKFKIIGQPQGNSAVEKIKLFKNYSCVQYLGQLPREDVISQIASSKGLINFSEIEGFPNSFLEAWSCGIPVYSLWVDPGSVIEKYNLGRCFHGDLDSMAIFLQSNISTTSSDRIKEYVILNHSFENAASRFLEAISDK